MLSNKAIWNIEFRKLLHRKDVWIMLTMFGIPALYSIGVFLNSSAIVFNGEGKEYAMGFFLNMFFFVDSIFIYFFILSLIASRSLGGEIENKSILLYTQRINNRRKIYQAKVWSLIAMVSLICIIFFLVTMAMFYIFAVQREDIISSQFIKKEELVGLFLFFLSIVLVYIFTINLSVMLSTFFKTNTTVIIFSILFIVFIFISKFPGIKYISLQYYTEQLSTIDLSNTSKIFTLFSINLGVSLIYSIICNLVGIKRFERRDL